jgi:hypothetical protein
MRTRAMVTMKRVAGLGAVALMATPLCAQMHKVEKPERVTRSIGVYEWTGDLKKPDSARLIPVSLFINSHFEDGDLYLARPVPFTLETGDEYSIERSGQSLGMFDVEYARDVVTQRAAADDDPVGAWYGYGTFAVPKPPKKSTLTASAKQPRVLGGGDDDQPRLAVRAGAEDNDSAPAKDSKGAAKNPSATTSAPPNPAPDDDPDRPTLRHRDPKPDTDKHDKKQKDGGSVIPMSTSLNDDPDRPVLERGVPKEQAIPKPLTGLPPSLHQVVAVSDPSNQDAHIFTRDWESSSERAETLKDTEALARPLIAAYLTTNKLQPVAAAEPAQSSGPSFASKPAPATQTPAKTSTTASRRNTVKKPAAPAPLMFALTNEEISGYELSYGGLPTFIFTSETPVAAGGPVYLTMVVQRLPAGELQVALTNVTDATHMNRVPWMRPVDVVDPDGGHRASLLMELRAQSSRQFALYSLVTAKAQQQFVTGVIE